MTEPSRNRLQLWVSLPHPPEAVWAAIGDFAGIARWHPEIVSAELVEIDGDTHRHLRLADGALVLERLSETGDLHYSYEIVEGTLPLSDHRATLSCVAEDDGCHVFWSAVFEPGDPAVDDIVEGFYRIGLEALRARFGGRGRAAARRAGATRR
ncbi:MAG TPA: SRPBCC family protein [Thermohalobaculum sp.]|nr:SRPBCC family protein [Thermohalobaculum sp.]